MVCKQCNKNPVVSFPKKKICNSCYSTNYRKLHPEKRGYKYGGNGWKAVERDGNQCLLCDSKSKKLDIHHLDKNEKNNTLDNLIAVCRACHRILHSGRKLREDQWTYHYTSCIMCGTTNAKHAGKGYCISCYQKKRKKSKALWYQRRGKQLEKLRKHLSRLDKKQQKEVQ